MPKVDRVAGNAGKRRRLKKPPFTYTFASGAMETWSAAKNAITDAVVMAAGESGTDEAACVAERSGAGVGSVIQVDYDVYDTTSTGVEVLDIHRYEIIDWDDPAIDPDPDTNNLLHCQR